MLDLEAGVHLEEPEPGRVIRVDQELDGSRALVVDRRSGSSGRLVQCGTDLSGKARRRRLLDHLLVSALQRAVPLAEDEYAAGVAHDLDLDVANVLDVPLDEDRRVPERTAGLGRGGGNLVGELGQRADDAHAAAAPACRRLDQQWQVRLAGGLHGDRSQHRHARSLHQLLRRDLRPHRLDRGGRRADPDEPGVDDGASELGVLGEEAVAGVDRVRASLPRGRDNEVDAQVGLRRSVARQSYGDVRLADVGQRGIGVGVDSDGLDPESAAGPEDPAGDLGPVGDEESLDGRARQARSSGWVIPSHPENAEAVGALVGRVVDH